MADKPILFSAPMVRALLAGTKTQTRRLTGIADTSKILDFVKIGTNTKTGRSEYEMKDKHGQHVSIPSCKHCVSCHYSPRIAVGDRLYVREHWKIDLLLDALPPRSISVGGNNVLYLADGHFSGSEKTWIGPGKHRQAMHMPRWASRLTLVVTDVRVQQLQDISEADAIAEGVGPLCHPLGREDLVWVGTPDMCMAPARAYAKLWDSINGPGAWNGNPFVTAYSFEVHRGNIDQIGGDA